MESNSWTYKKQSSRFFHFSRKMISFQGLRVFRHWKFYTGRNLILDIFGRKMKIFEFFVTKILKVSSVWYWFIQHKPLYINFRHCVRWKETPTTRSSPGDYYDLIRKSQFSQFSSKSQKTVKKLFWKTGLRCGLRCTTVCYGHLRNFKHTF